MPPSTGSGTGTPVTGVSQPFEAQPFFSSVWIFDNSASAYVDRTLEAQSPAGTAFAIFEDVNDRLYLGMQSRFDLAAFVLSGLGSISGLTYQYYRSATWTTFIPGLSYDFTTNGAESFDNLVNWTTLAFSATVPHAATPPDTDARYWIRIYPTAVTTAPTVFQIQARPYAVYCTATDVANLLQLANDFSSTTTPTRNTVEDYIHSAQSYIDFKTRKSWRINAKIDEEHQFNISGFTLLERDPIRVHRLEIWNGGEYERLTEGRTGSFFLTPGVGSIYFSRYFMLPARLQSYRAPTWAWDTGEFSYPVRVSYLYGSNIYTNEREGGVVQDIAKKLAAIDLINSIDFGVLAVSGGDRIQMREKVQNWKLDVEERLESIRGWEIF